MHRFVCLLVLTKLGILSLLQDFDTYVGLNQLDSDKEEFHPHRYWKLKNDIFTFYFIIYCLHYYRYSHPPPFACVHPPTLPIPPGHHHTVVCIYRLSTCVLWLIPSPLTSNFNDNILIHCYSNFNP